MTQKINLFESEIEGMRTKSELDNERIRELVEENEHQINEYIHTIWLSNHITISNKSSHTWNGS